MITDYASLKAAVAQWYPRADVLANIADAVTLAEAQINRTIRNRQQEQRATATLTEFTELQADYIEVRDVFIQTTTGNRRLDLMSPSQLNDIDYDYAGSTGVPRGYAIVGNQYKVAPSPDQSYTVEMVYVKQVPALSGTATTNWFLTDHPDCYLAGVKYHLLQMCDDPRAADYLGLFMKLLEDVNRADRRQRWSGSPMAIQPG